MNHLYDIYEHDGDKDTLLGLAVLWPVYLVIGALLWCIEKIDKMMED